MRVRAHKASVWVASTLLVVCLLMGVIGTLAGQWRLGMAALIATPIVALYVGLTCSTSGSSVRISPSEQRGYGAIIASYLAVGLISVAAMLALARSLEVVCIISLLAAAGVSLRLATVVRRVGWPVSPLGLRVWFVLGLGGLAAFAGSVGIYNSQLVSPSNTGSLLGGAAAAFAGLVMALVATLAIWS